MLFLGFYPTFSRHGIAQILSALALLIWLDEKVGFVVHRSEYVGRSVVIGAASWWRGERGLRKIDAT